MSNIKLIDGIAIDIEEISYIQSYESMTLKKSPEDKQFYFKGNGTFYIQIVHKEEHQNYKNNFIGHVAYKTKEECEARIKQILEKQNSNKIEI